MTGAAAVELLAPGLLESTAGTQAHYPALQFLLACARHRCLPDVDSPARQLCRAFGINASEPPVAAITRQYDCGDAGLQAWMRADPVHVEPGYQGTVHVAQPMLNAEEAAALVGEVAGAFTALKAVLSIGQPGRWYLCLSVPPRLRTTPPAPVCALSSTLPTGPDGLQWHRALNLVQMILHDSEINRRRVQRDELTVDSLWCWGMGSLPWVKPPAWTRIYSDDPLAHALAALCKLASLPWPVSIEPLCASPGPVLATLQPSAYALPELERDYFAPLLAALRSRYLTEFCLRTTTQEFRITRPCLLLGRVRNLWRRPRALSEWLPD